MTGTISPNNLRFAANLSFLFTERPFLDRFAAAAQAGFQGVEFLFPYDHPADEIAEAAQDANVEIVLFNLPPGDWDAGERGLAALPGREAEVAHGLNQAVDYAIRLNVRQLHVMAGVLPPNVTPEAARETVVGNLQRACAEAARASVTLLIEPINTRDMPGYALSRTEDALDIIDAVAAPNIGLQLDLYHRQIMQGDLTAAIDLAWPVIRHTQIANPPDRSAPNDGEINYAHIFRHLMEKDYAGWIGCEYGPKGRTEDNLGWLNGPKVAGS
ncbi:MAG: 2-oxo-tetronate isomerase [Pseudomonadota bacterium]